MASKEVRRLIAEIRSKPCTDCGRNPHPAAMEFDHCRGEKKLEFCHSHSLADVLAEIEKCDIVCANCHRIREYKRREETKIASQNI